MPPGGFFGVDLVVGVHLGGTRVLEPLTAIDSDQYDAKLYISHDQTIDVDDLEVNNLYNDRNNCLSTITI